MIDLSQNILYEDSDILVINKPAGLVVHPDGRTREPSVSEWFAENYPDSKDVGEPIILNQESGVKNHDSRFVIRDSIQRAGIVHRIDRDTSGILLLAKTKAGHTHLKEQFMNREVEKAYHLFVYGNVKDDRGTINMPIGRSSGDFRKWSAQKGARGEKREAITYYEVLKRSPEKEWTLVEAKPKTGRTHQLRVHFLAIHHPVVADGLYAASKPKILGFERLALHARKILFKNMRNEEVFVEAPYTSDFQRAVDSVN